MQNSMKTINREKSSILKKYLTPGFGRKKTCFGILSIIKQTLTNVLFVAFSSLSNGVLPKRKSLPKKKREIRRFFQCQLCFFFIR